MALGFLFGLLTEILFLFFGGILVLLVLGDEVVHVARSLSELHLIHALTCVPVEEGLLAEHGSELLRDALEQLLDGCAVANEGDCHLETTGWDVANSCLGIVGDPFHGVAAVLILHVEHLLIHLLHVHPPMEHSSHGEVPAMVGVTGSHHVLGIEELLGELRHREGPILLAATAG